MLSKSKENNTSTHLRWDLKDVKCYTYRKKGYYLTTCTKAKDNDPNKMLVGQLGHYVVEELGKGNPLSKASFKG